MSHDWSVERPSSADFERALQRMDARTFTAIFLQGDGEQHLAIGGGAGRYNVYITFDNEQFWVLLTPEPVTGTILLNAGGQEGDFEAEQIVSQEQACAAGIAFLETRRLDPTQRWQQQ